MSMDSMIVGKTSFVFPSNYPIDMGFISTIFSRLYREGKAYRQRIADLKSFMELHRQLSYEQERDLCRFKDNRAPSTDLKKYLRWRDGNACRYCGSKIRIQYEHVIPFTRGGRTTPGNMVCACYKCNMMKRNKTPDECGLIILPLDLTANGC